MTEIKEQISKDENIIIVEESIQNSKEEKVNNLNLNPLNWSKNKKLFTLSLVGFVTMTSPIANSILYPSIIDITESLHTTKFLSNALISISTFFNGIAPLGWASYSEVYETRKKAYVISLLLFMITSITCAVATNIWLLLIMRGLQASGVSAALCIGAGTISDIYIPTERGTAYGYFSLVIVIGPIIGPIVGGYITDYLGWRWIFWFLSIFGSLTLISLFFISETYNSKITFTIKHDDMMKKKKFNPFLPLYMFKYPNKFYGLSPSKAGLVFISLGLGQILGNVIGGKWSDIVLIKFKNKNNGKLIPEQRINSIWLGSIIIPLIFIAYGWLIERKVHISLPIILIFLSGFSVMTVYTSTSAYLIDSYPDQSASAISTHVFLRSVLTGIFSLFTILLQDSIGLGWMFTLLGAASLLSVSALIIVYFKGAKWREQQIITIDK
ncbi:uncharacterized protein OCT59_020248 [Rhizophagus irregularis]|uniref:Flr1p n=2 Tax=Rhizophagus irregularis TaxID=588596 RepID=A0A015JUW4_RHIIW|nr:major facilitator superfamily domain-containing protein [Rhizophagus irregularis DAOM 181602=DAOM 197198]EXX71100.1 Flr1p [Rhizophagus irregularis DAOM 197198w]POG80150.1 major facilitator superfamily domain-containing protein [Rhizophagus irregularis DAOM 181602=DAOM 197198]UZO01737.1 hypothetical protein OCT59_020248 [Rhizophagus irregularis]GBC25925.1 major facilitator superfamily domain-containing protein [Rhizophagus irregularis DAOM 181602=DAOM 197198]|eukprot:XP_025187016.1 major facilitator superfamily domain-containing protein [Rhizophagus irregularis DAOM 181602=DAOM 197198]